MRKNNYVEQLPYSVFGNEQHYYLRIKPVYLGYPQSKKWSVHYVGKVSNTTKKRRKEQKEKTWHYENLYEMYHKDLNTCSYRMLKLLKKEGKITKDKTLLRKIIDFLWYPNPTNNAS